MNAHLLKRQVASVDFLVQAQRPQDAEPLGTVRARVRALVGVGPLMDHHLRSVHASTASTVTHTETKGEARHPT